MNAIPDHALLAPFHGARPPAPRWFRGALAVEPERSTVEIAGATIETLAWGRRGAPGLLLLHGQGAHADWWSFIAPFFADHWRVATLSWSGMGRSDWREQYDFPTYAEEAFAAARACGLYDDGQAPVVVGHSFGGIPTIYAARARPQDLRAAVLLDCYFGPGFGPTDPKPPPPRSGPLRVYRELEDALVRFRFAPPQGCEHPYIADHIARQSLKQIGAGQGGPGWTWRFDPSLRAKMRRVAIAPYLAGAEVPLVIMSGARSSLMRPEVCERMLGLAPPGTPWIAIPDADHHVMVDQPLALVAALQGLLAAWPRAA